MHKLNTYFDNLTRWKQHGLAFLIILILMGVYFSPMVFQNEAPEAEDSIAWVGASEAVRNYNATHDDIALWAPNLFSGMPAANISVPVPVYSVDDLLKSLGISWEFLFFVLGGFFFYIMLRLFGLSWLPAITGAIIFILIPHHLSLINAGHNTKIRAIMLAPIVGTAFLYFVNKTTVYSVGFLVLALALQTRTNHYQIVYYTGFFLLFLGIPYLVQYIRNQAYGRMFSQLGLLLVAILLAAVVAAPRMVLTQQYLPYSIRGGGADTEHTTATGGLEMDYATRWSFPPEEIVTFVIPDFFGGSSRYHYTGDAAPQLQGRNIPGYWGRMPFTSSVQYLGALSVFLALIGIVGSWRRSMVKSMVAMTILALLIAFGKYFPLVFDFFFAALPLFDKFRVPSMILYLLRLSIPILAAFGLERLLRMESEEWKRGVKWVGGVAGLFLILSLIPLLFGGSFSLTGPNEASQYQERVLQLIRNARLELMQGDALGLLLFTIIATGVTFAYARRYLSKSAFALILIGIILIDMYMISHRYIREWNPQPPLKQQVTETRIDRHLLQDESLFRIFPVGQGLFGGNRWAYFHQSIGGYHAAKMQIYQKMIEENLYNGWESDNPINWNIVRMLNVKYLIANNIIRSDFVEAIGQDPDRNWVLHRMKNPPPRAWMVYSVREIPDISQQRSVLNNRSFRPMEEALAESDLLPDQPDTSGINHTVEVTHFDANTIELDIETDRKGLLVVSENYLPIWWRATLDGEPIPIHRVNTFQRGIVVPSGPHQVRMHIEAPLFKASIDFANITVWVIHIIVLGLLLTQLPVPAIRKVMPFTDNG